MISPSCEQCNPNPTCNPLHARESNVESIETAVHRPDHVQISNAALAAFQEATEFPAQTVREAAKGHRHATGCLRRVL